MRLEEIEFTGLTLLDIVKGKDVLYIDDNRFGLTLLCDCTPLEIFRKIEKRGGKVYRVVEE